MDGPFWIVDASSKLELGSMSGLLRHKWLLQKITMTSADMDWEANIFSGWRTRAATGKLMLLLLLITATTDFCGYGTNARFGA